MRATLRATALCGAVLVVGVALSACTGEEPVASPTASSASAAASSTERAIDLDEAAKWCTSYAQITANLGALGQTAEDAATGLQLLTMFDRLWITAGLLELVNDEEVAANRATVKAYSKVMQIVADGASEDEIREADVTFTAATEEVRAELSSSAQKIIAICQLGSPSPSAGP